MSGQRSSSDSWVGSRLGSTPSPPLDGRIKQAPPIPKRDRWPAQPGMMYIRDNDVSETSFTSQPVGGRDSPLLLSSSPMTRSRSFSQGMKAADKPASEMPEDTEGYLMPKELAELTGAAKLRSDRQSMVSPESKSTGCVAQHLSGHLTG